MLHMIGLGMGLGTGFAHMYLGKAASKMEEKEAIDFLKKVQVINSMGDIGTALLLISGLYMMTPYWQSLFNMPTLMLKLAFFIVLTIIVAFINRYAKKAVKQNDPSYFAKMEKLGKYSLPLGVMIIVLAVATFF